MTITLPSDCSTKSRAYSFMYFEVYSGIATVTEWCAHWLKQQNFTDMLPADICLILDIPHGFAMHYLATYASSEALCIVTTTNMCPLYWDDLWDFDIAGLLVSEQLDQDLSSAIEQVTHGQSYRSTPAIETTLTPSERRVFRFLVHGFDNAEIATQLSIGYQRVKNTIASIYAKLDIKDRHHALLYYWGTYPWLSQQPQTVCPGIIDTTLVHPEVKAGQVQIDI